MEQGNTLLFSDIHIGIKDSYGWFDNEFSEKLSAKLMDLSEDDSIKRIIFAGDIFDTWVYKINDIPESVDEIIKQWEENNNEDGSNIIKSLQQCINSVDEVYYIEGNHDMFITQEQLNKLSDKIKLCSFDDIDPLLNKIFGKDVLHIEHGNMGDIFNLRVPEKFYKYTYKGLPFGYFVARLNLGNGSKRIKSNELLELGSIISDTIADEISEMIKVISLTSKDKAKEIQSLFEEIEKSMPAENGSENLEESFNASYDYFNSTALGFPHLHVKKVVRGLVKHIRKDIHKGMDDVEQGMDDVEQKLESIFDSVKSDFLKKLSPKMVDVVCGALQLKEGIEDNDSILIDSSTKLQVKEIRSIYSRYFQMLDGMYDDKVVHWIQSLLAGALPDGLGWFAELLSKNKYENIILGHTHKQELENENKYTYENNGCWCEIGSSGEQTYTIISSDGKPKCFGDDKVKKFRE